MFLGNDSAKGDHYKTLEGSMAEPHRVRELEKGNDNDPLFGPNVVTNWSNGFFMLITFRSANLLHE